MAPSDATLRADAVVIGTGAGGAPAAALLAEAGLEVIALEAGPRLGTADFRGDEGAAIARLFAQAAAEQSGMALFAGSCVGGSTVVNDALCWRPPPEVLEAWRRQHGLVGLSDAALAPFVERAWRDVHASPTDRAHLNRNAYRLELGARRLGWAAEAMPRNVRDCANLGLCNFGCPTGAKQSALLTYVPRAERAGARVLAEVRAQRVELEAGRVRAVRATRSDGEPLRLEAPLVCVAAGVLETPALLLRSGLAGEDGVVGRGLQLHSSAYVTARFREPIHAYYGPTMAYSVTEFADVNGRRGPGFLLENVTLKPASAAMGLPGFGAAHAGAMAALPHLARCVVLLHDRARGRVRLRSDGRARIGYAPLPEDLARLRQGLVAAGRAYLAAGAEELYLPVQRSAALRSEAELEQAAARAVDPSALASLYAVHLFGGAAMGGGPTSGACDEQGQVWGVRGLYVCDASALPSSTGVNPQITIMANALRVAAGIAASRSAA